MGLRINTNALSLFAQRTLSQTSRAMSRAIARLASGQRINTGRDDPAGLAIAGGLEAQRRGTIQAIRNINDARGFLETADGALDAQTTIVQRMKELAAQASNGTLTSTDRASLDTELQQLLAEFNRITTQTQFNGVNLLDGSFGTKNIQVGSFKGATIDLNLTSMQTSRVFTQNFLVANGTFQARTTVAVGVHLEKVVTGDVNGDGYADIITGDVPDNTLSVLLGNGNGTFKARTTLATGSPRDVKAVDINGDGKIDLIAPDSSTSAFGVFLGNGDGTFRSRVGYNMGTSPYHIALADLNGDGRLDAITSDILADTASIRLGNGDGTFQARTTIATGDGPIQDIAIDLNGDGKLDLIVADNLTEATASIFLGNGNGTFAVRATVATGVIPWALATADLNGDGKVDFVSADSTGGTLSIFLGNGNGTFLTRSTVTPQSTFPHGVMTADINGDGKFDLISAESGGSALSIFVGNGNGTFQPRKTVPVGSGPQWVTGADLNGDGLLDLISSDFTNNTASILLANGVTTTTSAQVSITTQTQAQNMLAVFDTALSYISSARASIGAVGSRLNFAGNVSEILVENLSSAKAEISDTDYSVEVAEFARLQILQRAGIMVLSQANTSAELALKLLESSFG
jgi:flagellin-like hook-associated protein FlgL